MAPQFFHSLLMKLKETSCPLGILSKNVKCNVFVKFTKNSIENLTNQSVSLIIHTVGIQIRHRVYLMYGFCSERHIRSGISKTRANEVNTIKSAQNILRQSIEQLRKQQWIRYIPRPAAGHLPIDENCAAEKQIPFIFGGG